MEATVIDFILSTLMAFPRNTPTRRGSSPP
jgi:hypothetical protein